jgi:hypothetical protein
MMILRWALASPLSENHIGESRAMPVGFILGLPATSLDREKGGFGCGVQ